MISDALKYLLASCTGPNPVFPPELLYNEGWMLRLVLQWFASHPAQGHPLDFPEGARWFSEARLPSPFGARFHGDPLSESRPRAGGVMGHLTISSHGESMIQLNPDSTHLLVCEARIAGGFSEHPKNPAAYDLIARMVAATIETVRQANASPNQLKGLGLCVLAPLHQLQNPNFTRLLEKPAIQRKIEARVQQYQGERDAWWAEWFMPVFPKLTVQAIAWEAVIAFIADQDSHYSSELGEFYKRCLFYHQSRPKRKK